MAIQTTKIEAHWNYFLAIENELEKISKYVEFDKKNFKCFSIEIARILLASAAETDVVCKQICRNLDAHSQADNIHHYRDVIRVAYPQIVKFQVLLPRFGLKLMPWDQWKISNGVPLWWTAYNKLKHHRDSEYVRANLKNALNAVAGLYVMVLYLYKEKATLGELVPSPQILRPGAAFFMGAMHGGYDIGFSYKL